MTTAQSPLVTVVVIFLNEEAFLADAIESVRAQTFDDWELLACDDGSSDGSTTIARQYEHLDSRIRALEHPGHSNRGMSATRNLGLRHARGRYLALLDADDVWLPHKLERQIALLERHPEAGMLCGASEYWHSWTGRPGEKSDVVVPLGAPGDTLVAPPNLATMLYPLGVGAAPCPSDVVFRTDAIKAVGGFEEHFLGERQLYEDQAFLSKMYLHFPVYVSGSCLSRYRQRPDSCVATVRARGAYHDVRRYFLAWLSDYVAAEQIVDRQVLRALDLARKTSRGRILRSKAAPAAGACRSLARSIVTRVQRRGASIRQR